MLDDSYLDNEDFEGGVFSKEIEGGRAGAFVRAGDQGITARTQDNREFYIPYTDCELEMGGASGRMVFCRTRDRSLTIFCEDKRFPTALQRSAVELHEEVDLIQSLNKRQQWNSRFFIWVSLLLTVLVLVGGYIGIMYGARAAVSALPYSVDEELGREMLPEVMAEFGDEIEDEDALKQIQEIVDRLQPHSPLKEAVFDVHLVDSPTINAMALPGGQIIVFRGLIDNCENAEQVAAVIGHEMAHVTQRHHVKRLGRSLGFIVALQILVGDAGGLAATISEVLTVTAMLDHSREQETEADLVGARILHDAGIDPANAIKALQAVGADVPGDLDWLASHPDLETRVRDLEQLVADLPAREYSGLDFDLEGLRQRLNELNNLDEGNPDKPE